MPVVIEELDVQVQAPAPAPPAALADATGGAAADIDERALQAALVHEAWRRDRLAAD